MLSIAFSSDFASQFLYFIDICVDCTHIYVYVYSLIYMKSYIRINKYICLPIHTCISIDIMYIPTNCRHN